MNNCKLKFWLKAAAGQVDDRLICEQIDDYMGCLYQNGQIVGGYDIFKQDGIYYASFVQAGEDSLNERYNSEYVDMNAKKLSELLNHSVVCEGENLEYAKPCTCEKPSWYWLSTEHFQSSSPLSCGDCDSPIPLYKVPHLPDEKDHSFKVLGWQEAYKAMQKLWLQGNWDRFTYGQLSKFNSDLNKLGQKLCNELEAVLGAPVYNYIYVHSECSVSLIVPKGMLYQTPLCCPKCGAEWSYCGAWNRNHELLKWHGKENTASFKSEFALCKCDACRIVMDNPDWTEQDEASNDKD